MRDGPLLEVKVWGELACFTRPEAKVERVSYPVMTPSAARGILEAIFWKPQFMWHVHKIAVLKPISYLSFIRNEVNSAVAAGARLSEWERTGDVSHYLADADRAQRHTLALRDVAYVIYASTDLLPHAQGEDTAKYRDQFRRRVSAGQCFHRPYLGCREFAAHFAEPADDDRPVPFDMDLGRMLFDIAQDGASPGVPHFFEARLEQGIIAVPQDLYGDVFGGAS